MDTMIQNFLNGNLTTARKQAKRFSYMRIYQALMAAYGYRHAKAYFTTYWLKGHDCYWQAACDAE